MGSLCDDLWTEVFIRLPDCREAVRCGAVCKRWFSIVSTAGFVRSFTGRLDKLDDANFYVEPIALLLQKPVSDLMIFFMRIFHKYYLVSENYYLNFRLSLCLVIRASCDDVLLVSLSDYDITGRLSLCIYNPILQKNNCSYIPEPPIGIASHLMKCALKCRPDGSYQVTLFSFPSYSDYEDLHHSKFGPMLVSSFSSETGQWGTATVSKPPHVRMGYPFILSAWGWSSSELVACDDGFVYWLEGLYPRWESVVSFDTLSAPTSEGHQAYEVIPRPDEAGIKPSIHFVRLGAYRGRLRALCVIEFVKLKVWELTRTGDSCHWSLVHDVRLSEQFCCGYVQPLALHPADCDVVFLQIKNANVLQYNMSTQTGKYIAVLPFTEISYELVAYPLCSTWPTPIKHPVRSL